MRVSGGIEWVMVVNLIIWTGLFLYLRRLDRKLRALEAHPPLEKPTATATAQTIAEGTTP
jgi:CcmD family protein